ncbi:hypothetical protein I546_3518 [Mycobacterium kansasii 732]|nr:hypothetical protein I546_3518 [Mycobacterium kansasii 732]
MTRRRCPCDDLIAATAEIDVRRDRRHRLSHFSAVVWISA